METELLKTLEAAGVQVFRLSEEERAIWQKATASVIDGLAGTVSPEVLEAGKKINEVYGK